MATRKQIEANRRNAKKSTGPRTPEGKRKSSMNALKHGFRSQRVLLPEEDPEELRAAHEHYRNKLRPTTPEQETCVAEYVDASWQVLRAELAEHEIYEEQQGAVSFERLEPLLDYRIAAEDRGWRALKRLADLQRGTGANEADPADHNPENLTNQADFLLVGSTLTQSEPISAGNTLSAFLSFTGEPNLAREEASTP